jgi:N-methylhydantoinase A
MKRFAISVDIGGTFTDFVVLDGEKRSIATAKVLTTPDSPDEAIFQGIDQLRKSAGFDLGDCDVFLHATTIITNAVIERRGHDFILLHTEGFGSTLETGREHRYNLTKLRLPFPKPITKAHLKVPVRERVSYTGSVVQEPDKNVVLDAVSKLVAETGIENFAICFMHAFHNPVNENLVAEWLAERFPKAVISTSSAVAPRQREYERWITCAVNAYTKPILAQYVDRLEKRAADRRFRGNLLMMTSSGLPLPIKNCVHTPVRLIESGPAAGVLAAKDIGLRNAAQYSGKREANNVLAYDMGGTTAKGAFLMEGKIEVVSGLEIAREGAVEAGSGFPLIIPAIDLIEIGAGGGSIAEIDARGVIAVGPRSAGAVPGPACYGRGGSKATATDANLFLGLLGENNFRNSGIDASAEKARESIEKEIARPLGISTERAAQGIHRTINENVARAFRVHAAELGIDYRRSTLVCTGGSSPIHSMEIAKLLGIGRVIFPFAAGVASAMGLFTSNEGIVLQRSKLMRLADLAEGAVAAEVGSLVQSESYARDLMSKGARTSVKLGMRYSGQSSEIMVGISNGDAIFDKDRIRDKFLETYAGIFGLTFPTYEIEISTWIVEVALPDHINSIDGFRYQALTAPGNERKGARRCYVSDDKHDSSEWIDVPVFDRYGLSEGWSRSGPLLIEEKDTTIYAPPSATVRVASTLDIIAEFEA